MLRLVEAALRMPNYVFRQETVRQTGVPQGNLTDADRDSDGADFLTWQRQLGSGLAPMAPSQRVPEPSTVILLVGLTTAGILTRRGRCAV